MHYIKFDRYIASVELYCDSGRNNKKTCIPICYKIIDFVDMIDNTSIDKIYMDEHTCLIKSGQNSFQITPHIKTLSKNMVVIYKNICEFSNKIINNILIDEDDKIDIFLIDELKRAYVDKDMAFYENFIENKQYEYYQFGFSGIYKKYDFSFDNDGYLQEEYYINNDKINGVKKTYCHICGLIKTETYIDNKLNGEAIHYKHKNNCICNNDMEKYYYYSDNFYKYEKYDNNDNLIKSGYYFMDINVSWIYIF